MHPRRKARERVLQALYALELAQEHQDKILEDILVRKEMDNRVEKFIRGLFEKCIQNRDWCEQQIDSHLKNWDMDRIAMLDRLILVMAICEIYFVNEVPPKVSISEAIEIAKKYSTEESSAFVNGILDAVYRDSKVEQVGNPE